MDWLTSAIQKLYFVACYEVKVNEMENIILQVDSFWRKYIHNNKALLGDMVDIYIFRFIRSYRTFIIATET